MLSEIRYEELPSYEIGFEEGQIKGEIRGEKKGEIKGELKTKKMIIANLLKNGIDIQTIAKLTEIKEEEIKALTEIHSTREWIS